jgi:hypothetical protein
VYLKFEQKTLWEQTTWVAAHVKMIMVSRLP